MATPELVAVSTGPSGRVTTLAAFAALRLGELAIDAVEMGLMAAEADPDLTDIGYGGMPDAEGYLSLDAAIMDGRTHRAGAVAALRGVVNPIAVARRVMEDTPHVLIVGQGARQFATAQGFPDEGPLLTPEAQEQYEKFKRGEIGAFQTGHDPSHDTVGLLTRDKNGDLSAGCSTSGLAFKMPGRVGDSPIVGSGLYVDNGIGAATCMGMGEQMMQACLAYRVVLSLERGLEPDEACAEAVRYLKKKRPGVDYLHCCVIALRADGEVGGAGVPKDHPANSYYVARLSDGGSTTRILLPFVTV